MFSTIFTYSAPLDIGQFYCSNGTNPNEYCCPLLAHRISSTNYPSKTILLTNKSGYNLSLKGVNLEYGKWVKGYNLTCELQTNPLPNGRSEAFSSDDLSILFCDKQVNFIKKK